MTILDIVTWIAGYGGMRVMSARVWMTAGTQPRTSGLTGLVLTAPCVVFTARYRVR